MVAETGTIDRKPHSFSLPKDNAAGGEPPDGLFGTTFSEDGDDRDRLVDFLKGLERLLDFVVKNPDGMVPTELHPYLKPAWRRVRPRFAPAIAALEIVQLSELKEAGLTGAELDLKLAALRHVVSKFVRAFREEWRSVPKILAAVLGMAGVIIDSIPWLHELLEAIREFTSFVEKSADVVDSYVGEDVAERGQAEV